MIEVREVREAPVTMTGALLALAFILVFWKIALIAVLSVGSGLLTAYYVKRWCLERDAVKARADFQNALIAQGDDAGVYGGYPASAPTVEFRP